MFNFDRLFWLQHLFQIMTVANCKQSGSWKAGAGSADLYYQRQNRNGKKQLVHPQYNRDEKRVISRSEP